uniref:Bifunctional inhibitor/plant lipid transfer protein/seed storage helical domain-containing protein n=1 Tax=Oryza glumipatula TaxID=40148 RepID=A0A0D9ZXI8_9ORYZ
MKIIFVFALLSIAACNASAQYQLQSPLLLEQQVLSPYNDFVRQQYGIAASPFLQSAAFKLRNNQVWQQLGLQFGDLYFDRNLAQAQALLAFNVPSRYGIYPRYYGAPSTITTLGGVL